MESYALKDKIYKKGSLNSWLYLSIFDTILSVKAISRRLASLKL
jgi:hypothetical protein